MRHFHSTTSLVALVSSLGCFPASLAAAGDSQVQFLTLLLAREQDPETPTTAFRAFIEVTLPLVTGVTKTTAKLGGGTVVDLLWEPNDDRYEIELDLTSFSALQAAVHGAWVIEIAGDSPSTTTFVLNASGLQSSNFFECPQVVTPAEGATNVSPTVVFEWLHPTAGPFPAFIASAWVDNEVKGPGPSAYFADGATQWNPAGCLLDPGASKLGLSYIDAIPLDLVSAFTMTSGAIEWSLPSFAPPDYPANFPVIGLAGETRRHVTVAPPTLPPDLDCSGDVTAADLGILLGA